MDIGTERITQRRDIEIANNEQKPYTQRALKPTCHTIHIYFVIKLIIVDAMGN